MRAKFDLIGAAVPNNMGGTWRRQQAYHSGTKKRIIETTPLQIWSSSSDGIHHYQCESTAFDRTDCQCFKAMTAAYIDAIIIIAMSRQLLVITIYGAHLRSECQTWVSSQRRPSLWGTARLRDLGFD